MSITDPDLTFTGYGAGWSIQPSSAVALAAELVDRIGVNADTHTATVFDRFGNSAGVTRHLDGWVVHSSQPSQPWHRQLERLLVNEEEQPCPPS